MTDGDPALPAQGALEAYAALAAHQLGEAVALMRGASSVLEAQRGRLGPGGEDALRAIDAGSARAQRFVDDLLDLVRAGGEPVDEPPAALDDALDAVLADLDEPLRRASLNVLRHPLPTAGLAPSEAQMLLRHLVRAALAAGAHRLQFEAHDRDGAVVLEVLDDGAVPREGDDPFEPFQRPRGRGPYVGAGVGLVICRRLAERRGGRAELTRGEDRVMVTLHLPAA